MRKTDAITGAFGGESILADIKSPKPADAKPPQSKTPRYPNILIGCKINPHKK